jgi:hypothetical protein
VNTTSSGLAELADEGQVVHAGRQHDRPVARLTRQELACDKRHHAGDADAGVENAGGFRCDPEMTQHLRHDLAAGTR